MKNYLLITLVLILLSCAENKVEVEKDQVCDCKELQHDIDYNVLHLGDRLKPFTGKCFDYYRGGKIKKDLTLKDGKYEGQLFYYHKDGKIQSEVNYREGLLWGDKKVFNEKGDLLFHGIYKRNRLIETVFNINTQK